MFGESSAIYPHAVIHLLVPTMLRWNIVFDETFWIRTGPGKKSQFLPAPRNMNIWKVFALRHLWIFSDEGEKKKGNAHCIFDYSLDRYSHRATSWRCVWCTPFGSRWTIVSAKGNGRWWRLTIIFIRDALSNPLYLLAFGSERMPRKHLDSLPSCLYRNNRVCFPSSLYRSNL